MISIYWSNKVNSEFSNFGDCLNLFIFSLFDINIKFENERDCDLFAIGSLLRQVPLDYKGYIWSTGFIYPDRHITIKDGEKLLAVRGKLSLDFIHCSEKTIKNVIIGDGALLLSKIYPKMNISINNYKYKLGVIPHYVDIIENNQKFEKYKVFEEEDVVFIDPRINMYNMKEEVKHIIDLICSCEYIISSSLHGLIVCDSYGIKHASFTCEPSKNILHSLQHSFKFQDYYSAFNQRFDKPDFILTNQTTKEECISFCKKVDKPGLEKIKDDLLLSLIKLINLNKN